MIGYKIRYDDVNDYDRVVYKDFKKCESVRNDAQEQFMNHNFEIYCIEYE